MNALISPSSPTACSCGGRSWLRPVAGLMLLFWLVCAPLGFMAYLSISLSRRRRTGAIIFKHNPGGGSWRFYFQKIGAAQGSPKLFCQPNVVHALIRTSLGAGGATCGLMGMRAATSLDPVSTPILCGCGTVLGTMAAHLHTSIGRKIVVAVTILLAVPLGYYFVMDPPDGALRQVEMEDSGSSDPQKNRAGSVVLKILNIFAWLQVS